MLLTAREKEPNMMKPSTEDQLKGNLHESKGRGEGKSRPGHRQPLNEKIAGTIQKKIGQMEKILEK
jgi:hypothetical protein